MTHEEAREWLEDVHEQVAYDSAMFYRIADRLVITGLALRREVDGVEVYELTANGAAAMFVLNALAALATGEDDD